MKRFAKNPVGGLVVVIIALVILTAYMGTVVKVAVIVAAVWVIAIAAKHLLGGSPNTGHYCPHCSHPNHGRQQCGMCRCHR